MAAFEDLDDNEDTMSAGMGSIDLLWKGVVKPDEPLVASNVDKYFLRITNASFGPDVKKNTRTCLMLVQASDEESEAPGVVCTLKNSYESHQLDLLVSGDVQFQVSGENPSPIYLIGHLSPAEQHMSENPFAMDDEEEPTEEELEEMDNQTKKQLLQQLARKRKLAETEEDNPEDEKQGPAKKKKKGADAKPKPADTKSKPQDKDQNKNKNQKDKENNPKSKKETAESPKENTNKDDWKSGHNGLKYKDIRVGDGKAVVKKGSKVRVYYVGQLDNKKIFDKSIDGPGFEFTVGADEVIKGWDEGLNGMKVGGKRRLVIPPKMAYGSEGSPPDIPPNATLTFTIEVKNVTN